MILGIGQFMLGKGTYNTKFVLFNSNEFNRITRTRIRNDGTINTGTWESISVYRRNSQPQCTPFKLEFLYE
jgi:hypothetical protein